MGRQSWSDCACLNVWMPGIDGGFSWWRDCEGTAVVFECCRGAKRLDEGMTEGKHVGENIEGPRFWLNCTMFDRLDAGE